MYIFLEAGLNTYLKYKILGYFIGEIGSLCEVSSSSLAMLEKIKTYSSEEMGWISSGSFCDFSAGSFALGNKHKTS